MKAPPRSERKSGTYERWCRNGSITFRAVRDRQASIREADLDEVVVKHGPVAEISLAL